jgi:hypothetical protein
MKFEGQTYARQLSLGGPTMKTHVNLWPHICTFDRQGLSFKFHFSGGLTSFPSSNHPRRKNEI